MTGKLFLAGGGDENQSFEVDKIFFYNVNSLLYIPLARHTDDFDTCLEWFMKTANVHKRFTIEMLTDLNKDINFDDFDAIYIGGGNTFKLLKLLKGAGFDEKLVNYYNNGGKIYGGSAGAMIWGKDITISSICVDRDKNIVKLKDTSGMNKVNNLDIQCHYTDDQLEKHKDFLNLTKRDIIAIPEESALVVENGRFKVVGTKPITIIKSNTVEKHKVNTFIK
jgi:dipeptidase E